MKVKGIDISKWQGADFNLAKAKEEGQEFVIIKGAGGDQGLYVDPLFQTNYRKAKELKMPVGCYFFSKALTVEEAVAEAKFFYENCLRNKQFDLPVYYDVEHPKQLALSRQALTDIVIAFCDYLEKKNCWVGIYASKNTFDTQLYDHKLIRYTHWVAQWSSECTYGAQNNYDEQCLGMWQFGGSTNVICSTKVAGVVCDQNYMFVDFPRLVKAAGKNGYHKAPEKPVTPFKKGDKVKITGTHYATGEKIPKRVKDKIHTIKGDPEIIEGRVRLLLLEINSYVWADNCVLYKKNSIEIGDSVKIKSNAIYGGLDPKTRGKKVPLWVRKHKYHVDKIDKHYGSKEAFLKERNSWIALEYLQEV